MVMNASGVLSFGGTTTGQSINLEIGRAATAMTTINDSAVRNLLSVASGQISINSAYGKTGSFIFNQTISANTANYNLKSSAIAAGWDQVRALAATITINSGVYVYSTSTGAYSFQTGSTFPAGTVLNLINNGIILGMGGAGGSGGSSVYSPPVANNGNPGSAGGPALLASYAINITNNGTIAGGGGGGGGGGAAYS